MATNIAGVTITQPLTDPAIAPSGTFTIGGQITPAGGGAWAESGDMYAEWDQGTSTWTTMGSSGALNVSSATNPLLALQDANEHTWTVYNDGTTGTFQVRIKLIEDDLTEYTTAATTVTVAAAANSYPYTGTQGVGAITSTSDVVKARGISYVGLHNVQTNGIFASSGSVCAVDFAAVFDDVRQAIIDGIDGDLSTGTSWDSVRSGIAVGSVVRTSDTVVTITLDALATYEITADETLTVSVPWTAMTGGRSAAVVATPTVVIANTEAYPYVGDGTLAYSSGSVTSLASAGGTDYPYVGTGAYAYASDTVRSKGKEPSLGGALAYDNGAVVEASVSTGTSYPYVGDGVFAFGSETIKARGKVPSVGGALAHASDAVRAKGKEPSVGGPLAHASGTEASLTEAADGWTHVGTDATAAITAGTGSQDITLPGPPQRGDLVLVAVSGDISCADSITTSGYTLVENGTSANPGAHFGYKVMGVTPDTVVAIAQHTSVIKSAVVQVYRGGNRDDILDVSTAVATGSSATPQCNVIGTGTDNALVVVVAHLDDDDATVSAWPTSYDTWSVTANTGQSSTAIGSTVAMCARVVAAAGTETPSAFTLSSADQWNAIAISFKLAEDATAHDYIGLPTGCMALSAATVSSPPVDSFEYESTAVYSHAAGTVVTATPFDHMRRSILNSIVSAQSEATGWNALKGTIPLTAVVRTSDTVATVTLPALATYDITAAETLTVNVPEGATAAGDAIVGTPTVAIQTGGAHAYTGSAAMSFRGASAYSGATILLHVYTGGCTQVYSSGTVAAGAEWSDWSEVGTFTTAGIEVGGGMKYSAASTYQKGRQAFAYVGQGVISYANGMEVSVGRVYVGGGAYHFESGTVIANTVSVSYEYAGAGAIVHVAGTLYETDLAEDFPSSESYIGNGAYSFQSAFERVIGRAWKSPQAANAWSGGAVTAFVTSTWPRTDLEDVPALRTVSHEEVPALSTGQDGAWAEADQDGVWTEEPSQGAYTDIGYYKEFKPFNRFTATKEDTPS